MVESGYRQLIVMRHAKTEQVASSDRVRKLTSRGRRNARAAGVWIRANGLEPDLTLTSPATRALATAEIVCREFAGSATPIVVDDLYGASESEVVEIVADAGDRSRTVLVVGHNPTMEDLAYALQAEPADAWAPHLPTGGVAVIGFAGAWSALTTGLGALTHWHVPR